MNRTIAALTLAVLALGAPLAASAAPRALAHGGFVAGAHATSGEATIYRLEDGRAVLRLTDFSTSNGPKVHVVLTDRRVVGNAVVDAGSTDLGDLKGTSGNQNYVIPAGVALDKVKAVSIYCERFRVNFGAATLKR